MSEETSTEEPAEETAAKPADPVRRATFVVLGLILALICWYLVADRWTPFTSQARVKAYVVPITPQVSGRVTEVHVDNNQLVEPDQQLVTIDDKSYQLALRSAQAGLESARQALGAASAAVDSARAGVRAAQARLQKTTQDTERLERIYQEDPGAISERRVLSSRASLVEARSGVASAEANLEQALQNLGLPGEDNSRLLAAYASVDAALLDLERTQVRAPGRGLVTDLAVDRGNYAQAGAPLMTFIAIHDLWIQADFTENNLGHLKPGDTVDFVLDVQPGRVFSGRVRSIGYGVSSGSSTLGTLPTISNDPNWLRDAQRFPVVIDFPAEQIDVDLGLRVGSQVTVLAYAGDNWLVNLLGGLYIRIVSLFTYAY